MTQSRLVRVLPLVLLAACGQSVSDGDYFNRAESHYEKGEIKAAIIETKNALKQNPDNPDARKLLGRLYLIQGDPASAEAELQRHSTLAPNDVSGRSLMGQALVSQGKTDEVLALTVPDELNNTDKSDLLVAQGLSLLSKDDRLGAAEKFGVALMLRPKSAYALTSNARLHVVNQNYPAARRDLRSAIDTDPNNVVAWELLGDIALHLKEYNEAEVGFKNAHINGGGTLLAGLKYARILIQQQKLEEAEQLIDGLKKRHGKHPEFHLTKGLLQLAKQNLLEAQIALEEAVNVQTPNMQAVYYLSIVHLLQGNYGQAEQFGKQFYSASPDSAVAKKLLSRIRIDNKRFELAEEIIRPYALANRNDAIAVNLLATSLFKQNKMDEAIELLGDQAVQTLPDELASIAKNTNGETDKGQNNISEFNTPAPQLEALLAIKSHLNDKELDLALTAAEAFRDENPTAATPLNSLGRVYTARSEIELAKKSFNAALALAPENSLAIINLADIAIQEKRYPLAREYLNSVLQRDPKHIGAMLGLATIEWADNNKSGLLEGVEAAELAHPDSVQPKLLLAKYHLTQNQPTQALQVIEQVPQEFDSIMPVLSTRAVAELAIPAFEAAQSTLQKIIEIQPEQGYWRLLLARAHEGMGQRDQMKSALEKASTLSPDSLQIRITLARLARADGQPDELRKHLTELTRLAPDNAEVSELKLSLADLEKRALVNNASSTTQSDQTTLSVINNARSLWQKGARDEAFAVVQNWLNDNPNDLEAVLAIASMHVAVGSNGQAVKSYERVLELDSDNQIALNNLAWVLRTSDKKKALEYANRAANLDSRSAATLDTLAVVRLLNGQIKEAKAAIIQALERNPTNPTMQYHYAMIEAAGGFKLTAEQTLKTLLVSDVNFPEKADAQALFEKLSGN